MRTLALLVDGLLVASVVVAYCYAALAAGLVTLKVLGHQQAVASHWLVGAVVAFTVGQGALGILWQTLAAFGAFTVWLVSLVLLVLLLWAAYSPHRLRLATIDEPRSTRPRGNDDTFQYVLAAAVVGLVVLLARLSLLPPGTDALAFYMAQPKLIAEARALLLLPSYAPLAQISLHSEMHYAVFFAFCGDYVGMVAGKVFAFLAGISVLPLTWGCGQRLGLPAVSRWLLVLIIVSSTAVSLLLWDGKTDLIPTALALASLYFVLDRPLSRPAMSAAGLTLGLSLTSKLSFIPTFGATIAIVLLGLLWMRGRLQKSELKQTLMDLICLGAATAAPVALLVLKNTIVFNEPLAPFLIQHGAASFDLNQIWFSPENTRWIVTTYPFALIFGQYPMQHGNLSVLMLAALPLILLFRFRQGMSPELVLVSLAALAGTLIWVVFRPSVLAPRYILPSLIALAPLAAYLLGQVWYRGKWFDRFSLGIIVAALFVITAADARSVWKNTKAMSRTPSNAIWLMAEPANSSRLPATRVLNFTYYSVMFNSALLRCCIVTPDGDLVDASSDMTRFWTRLYERGITHVTLDRATHASWLKGPIDTSKTPDWLDVQELKIGDQFRAYELKPKAGAPPLSGSAIK